MYRLLLVVTTLFLFGCPAPFSFWPEQSSGEGEPVMLPAPPPEPEPAVSEPNIPPPPPPRPNLDGEWRLVGLNGRGEACLTIESDEIVAWCVSCTLADIEQTRDAQIDAAYSGYERCKEDAMTWYSNALADLSARGLLNTSIADGVLRERDEWIAQCRELRKAQIELADLDAEIAILERVAQVTCEPFVFEDGVIVWDVMLELLSGVYAYRIAVIVTDDGLVGVKRAGLGLVEQGSIEIIMQRR